MESCTTSGLQKWPRANPRLASRLRPSSVVIRNLESRDDRVRPKQAWTAIDLCYNDLMRQSGTKSLKRSTKGYVIGRASFAKISAVEGIRTTVTMDADFREFDRRGLSADQRRKIISRKYGKVRQAR